MSVQPVEVNDLACRRCGMTTDLCLSMRDDCCSGCTHYPEPDPSGIDDVAVERAIAGDRSVSLTPAENAEAWKRLTALEWPSSRIVTTLGTTHASRPRPARQERTMTEAINEPPTIDALLLQARRHPVKRIQDAAIRAQDAVQRVRDLIDADADKAEARERVARLERELREAKAALRGGSVPTQTAGGPPRTFGDGDHKCRKGCGKSSPNPQGRAAHERFCTHEAGAVA